MQEMNLSPAAATRSSYRNPPAEGRRARVVLVSLLCLLCVTLVPRTSFAAGGPWCDELAQSIEAPPIIWPHRGGSLQAVPPCPESRVEHHQGLPQRADVTSSTSAREVPVTPGAPLLAAPRTPRLSVPGDGDRVQLCGHPRAVYRPPRG